MIFFLTGSDGAGGAHCGLETIAFEQYTGMLNKSEQASSSYICFKYQLSQTRRGTFDYLFSHTLSQFFYSLPSASQNLPLICQ